MIGLNRREAATAAAACLDRVESLESLIEAHRVGWGREAGQVAKVIPAEYRQDVLRWRRQIAAAEKLRRRLLGELKR